MLEPDPLPAGSTISQERADALTKWLGIWIGFALVVVLILAVFLIAMLSSLNSIEDNLGQAGTEVVDSGRNTKPLSKDLDETNAIMSQLNAAMAPVPQLTESATTALRSIEASLGSVAGAMGTTERNLQATSGLLGATTNNLEASSQALGQISVSLAGAVKPLTSVSSTLAATIQPLDGISGALGGTEKVISSAIALIREITAHLRRRAAAQPVAAAGR